MIVFTLGLISHTFKIEWLYNVKNILHPIALALEFIVAIVYWPLRIFFLHLLTSKPKDFNIPIRTDLSIHLMPVISLLIDYLIFMPRWTIKNSTALYLIVSLTTFYWFLLKHLIDVDSGAKYPYAFMDVENDSERVVIFGVVALVAFSQFLFMKELYDFIVRKTERVDDEIDKKID
ncbi:unnamed protein product [Candida verbasci]|uniref:FAR-17a/AIG1-like protein n=1 Tax=Candida verbasci TaxID=1227364 RepID=A0A9W4TZW0_9ASCO|nr:unnamed protein product [Candida verbasci]